MEIIIVTAPTQVAEICADIFCRTIHHNQKCVLGLATGNTPVLLYEELIQRYRDNKISFKEVTTFNLDEYVGLPQNHKQSYRYFMETKLFKNIDISQNNTHLPNVYKKDILSAGEDYEALIKKAGGIDLQLLGIGTNGHIGFNEPTSSLGSRTRVKTLTPQTMKDNNSFFSKDEVQPKLAITMGIGTIMDAKQIVLLATGHKKAKAIQQAVEGPISSMYPASALQMHPKTTLILDEEAASLLTMKEYYQFVYEASKEILGNSTLK